MALRCTMMHGAAASITNMPDVAVLVRTLVVATAGTLIDTIFTNGATIVVDTIAIICSNTSAATAATIVIAATIVLAAHQ